ncbi:MAG: hypothetical protein R3C56_35450 [Pirellulaceae bacterium]
MQTYSRGLQAMAHASHLLRSNSAPACAYLAGTLALIRSQTHRAGTP